MRKFTTLLLTIIIFVSGVGSVTATSRVSTQQYVLGRPATQEEIENQKNLEKTGGYIPCDAELAPEITQDTQTKAAVALPAKFDLRDKNAVTPIKQQGETSACWAFATVNSAETNLLLKGVSSDSELDLSELQLAYFTYNRCTDPVGGLAGDKVQINDNYLDLGGNMYLAASALANWYGLTDEAVASFVPYDEAKYSWSPDSSYAYAKDTYHLVNSYRVNLLDSSYIKQLITEKGAAAVSYYHNTNNYNYDTAAYYTTGGTVNHAVSIVGWDDTYSRYNFGGSSGKDALPAGNGAWIVKNSWGEDWGDEGYFYLSYYDGSLGRCMSKDTGIVYFFDFEPVVSQEQNYQYDGGGSDNWFGYTSGYRYMANVFTVTRDEILTAVSLPTAQGAISYTIQVYTDISSASSPTAGKKALSSVQTGKLTYAGIHTIALDEPVFLSAGSKFSIVVSISHPTGYAKMLYDCSDSWGWINFDVTARKGESFVSTNGAGWTDMALAFDGNIKIKAFTQTDNRSFRRISGRTRYDTALNVCSQGWGTAETVVLASGLDYADSLCGVPLAYQMNAPILLTSGSALETTVMQRIKTLKTKNVIILGGTSRISSEAEEQLRSAGMKTERIAGKNRYATSAKVAEKLLQISGGSLQAIAVTGTGYADALSVSPYAASSASPILYVHPSEGLLSDAAGLIAEKKVYIIGGKLAVSQQTQAQIFSLTGIQPERVAGTSRYDTSLIIAKKFSENSGGVMLATGTNFPDALAGGVLAAKLDTPLLLVNPLAVRPLTSACREYVMEIDPVTVYILGGINAVPDSVRAQLFR